MGSSMVLRAEVLGFLLIVGVLGSAEVNFQRRNLKQQDVEGSDGTEYDGVFTEDDSTIFQLVSQCQPGTLQNYLTSFTLSNITATLEMDTAATYADNWKASDPRSWEPGNTRLNVSITYGAAPPAGTTLSAQLYTQVCSAGTAPATVFENNAGNTSAEVYTPLALSSTGGSASYVVDFLVNYDEAQSLVILTGSNQAAACCTLYPPMPDFPTDWSALMESNSPTFGVTFLSQLYYSGTLQKTRNDIQSSEGSRVILDDFNNKNSTIIYPANATYPHGYCQARPFRGFVNRFVDDDTDLLVSSSDFLFFNTSTATYNEAQISVRGITCEQWTDTRTVQVGRNQTSNATFEVSYAFPVNQWNVVRADYHRLLKQVYLNGSTPFGAFESYNNYVNFQPRNYTKDAIVFNVCAIAPQGQNCNCTAKEVADLVGLVLAQDDSVVQTDASVDNVCQSAIPHGFISQQAGPYVGLTVVGIVAGMLMMFTAMYVWFRVKVGVRLTDSVGHARFQDSTDSSGFK